MDTNAPVANEEAKKESPLLVVRPCEPQELVAIRRHFPGLPAEPAGTTLVAWVDGVPVGHVQIRWRGSVHGHVRARLIKTPEIRRLRVHPDAQGQGAAKLLLREAEELAVSRVYRSVGLAVGIHNEVAVNLYVHCGYVQSEIANFNSAMGMDDEGHRYTHTVQYMVKDIGRSARNIIVA
jgi:GNAT superfamily N-acetyltransferase